MLIGAGFGAVPGVIGEDKEAFGALESCLAAELGENVLVADEGGEVVAFDWQKGRGLTGFNGDGGYDGFEPGEEVFKGDELTAWDAFLFGVELRIEAAFRGDESGGIIPAIVVVGEGATDEWGADFVDKLLGGGQHERVADEGEEVGGFWPEDEVERGLCVG